MSAKAPNHVSRANKSQQSIAQSAARKEKPRKSKNVDSKKNHHDSLVGNRGNGGGKQR